MSANKKSLPTGWDDDDIPELTKDGIRPIGRPTLGDAPKKQVTLRLDADLIDRFRATSKGWQSRINAALRKAAGI